MLLCLNNEKTGNVMLEVPSLGDCVKNVRSYVHSHQLTQHDIKQGFGEVTLETNHTIYTLYSISLHGLVQTPNMESFYFLDPYSRCTYFAFDMFDEEFVKGYEFYNSLYIDNENQDIVVGDLYSSSELIHAFEKILQGPASSVEGIRFHAFYVVDTKEVSLYCSYFENETEKTITLPVPNQDELRTLFEQYCRDHHETSCMGFLASQLIEEDLEDISDDAISMQLKDNFEFIGLSVADDAGSFMLFDGGNTMVSYYSSSPSLSGMYYKDTSAFDSGEGICYISEKDYLKYQEEIQQYLDAFETGKFDSNELKQKFDELKNIYGYTRQKMETVFGNSGKSTDVFKGLKGEEVCSFV